MKVGKRKNRRRAKSEEDVEWCRGRKMKQLEVGGGDNSINHSNSRAHTVCWVLSALHTLTHLMYMTTLT